VEKKNPDQFYRIQGDNGNYEFYHRRNDAAGNSKHVFVQVDIRTDPEHTDLFHKSNNRIRLSEALWFPEGQTPSEPYDARSSRIVDMVMNRDLGLKELVDLKSKIDTMLEQGYKPSAYDLRALKNFMEGAQYNAGLDGGDPRLALVTLSISRALLGRDQIWAHFNNGKYDGGEKFETALNGFLKDEDGFWRKLRNDPSLDAPHDLPDLKTLIKYTDPPRRELDDPNPDIDDLITKYLREHPLKIEPGLDPNEEPMIYRYEPGGPKYVRHEPLKIDPEIFKKLLEPDPQQDPEEILSPAVRKGLESYNNDERRAALQEIRPQYQGEMGTFYKGLTPDQKSLFADPVSSLGQKNENGWGRQLFDVPDWKEQLDQHKRNLERFEQSLTPQQKEQWEQLKVKSHAAGQHFARPDDGIQRAPDVPESPFAMKYKPVMICSAGEAFKVSTLKGDPEKTMKMALGIGMDPSKISIHNGEMVTADSKVAPDLETPPPPTQKNTTFTV
jgi:hypothetical protein